MSELKGKTFRILEKGDLNYITGGATEINAQELNPQWKETDLTHKCHKQDAKKFEPEISGVNLNICHNCKHAKIIKTANSTKVYCSVDLI